MSEIAKPHLTPRGTRLGLYMHVPFCASTCDFCAFYQTQPKGNAIEEYLEAMKSEAALVMWDASVGTIFWGGGTPGLLPPAAMERLGRTVLSLAPSPIEEWTVEMAPASVTRERLKVLKDLGVTRISLGVQSFRDDLLDALGRQHTPAQVYRAFEYIREAAFASVNIDLMFALPGQEETQWLADLGEAMRLGPDHLSTYCLTFEEDTALWVKLSQGKVKLDTEREARLYERTWQELANAGYAQYEVSNFARPGHQCIHNVNTWRMQEWVGLGPSAASQHAGWRASNPPDLALWQKQVADGTRAADDRVALTPALLAEDAVIFGLRMNEGVNLSQLALRFPEAGWEGVAPSLDRLCAEGLATREAGQYALTLKGRLIADAIGSELLGAFSTTSPS